MITSRWESSRLRVDELQQQMALDFPHGVALIGLEDRNDNLHNPKNLTIDNTYWGNRNLPTCL
jgi:hypothetical protein